MTKFLLDTQAMLWIREGNPQLSQKARAIFLEQGNQMFFSLVSVWEMAIKRGLGKLTLKSGIQSFVESLGNLSISLLELRPEHLYKVEKLPLHHRDPFDRLLIAQALSEKMQIIGSDEAFDAYSVKRLW